MNNKIHMKFFLIILIFSSFRFLDKIIFKMVLSSSDSRLETSIDCICKLVDSENVKIMNKV